MSTLKSTLSLTDHFQQHGFAVLDKCLSAETVARFVELTESARERRESESAVANAAGVYALRNLTDVVPDTTELVRNPAVREIVETILGSGAFLIRSTLFDKTDGANWGVFWHQDLSIAVEQRHDVDGFDAWTRKAGVQCVQPPVELMARILTLRLHLDDCRADNGALKVLPGSHVGQRLTSDRIEQRAASGGETICEVPAGGAVLMCPLLLHASSPMERSGHRRVIHFEFAAYELPSPLQWRFRIPCT
jgi:ectoine hydroxylase-related dioxygenase (phytanoyl-CoA dioxygenase family)